MKDNYVLYNITIIDGNGGIPLENGAVVVKSGIIDQVGTVDQLSGIDNDIEKIDLGGYCLMPGMIDTHVHLGGMSGDAVSGWTIHPDIRLLKSIPEAQAILSYGFTSIRDVGSPGAVYLKRLVELGEITGPRIVACGRLLTRSGGHSDIPELPFECVKDSHYWGVMADGEHEIRKAIRMLLRQGADQIKFLSCGGSNNMIDRISDQHYSYSEIKTIVDESKRIKGTRVAAHAMFPEPIGDCIKAGVDSIEHGYGMTEEQAVLMAEKNIYLVPTLYLLINWYEEIMKVISTETSPGVKYGPFFHRDMIELKPVDIEKEIKVFTDTFELARSKGVRIALGSDTVNEAITKYGKYGAMELKTLVRCGMSPLDAITAATSTAAEVLGLASRIGSIKPGKIADMLVLKKNPAYDIDVLTNKENIFQIIQGGKLTLEDGKWLMKQYD